MDMPALVGTFKDLPVLKGLHWTSQDPAGPDGGLLETGRCPLGTRWVPREPCGFPGNRVGSQGTGWVPRGAARGQQLGFTVYLLQNVKRLYTNKIKCDFYRRISPDLQFIDD